MSMDQARYRLSDVQARPLGEPQVSYGISATRTLESLQTPELVDLESMLMNRYDIIGKCGYIYRDSASTTSRDAAHTIAHEASVSPAQPKQLMDPAEVNSFLRVHSDRDIRALQNAERAQWYRDDINTRSMPYVPQSAYVDTRRLAKTCLNSQT